MCLWCEKFGKGDRWYFNPENYARQLYTRKKPGEGPKAYGRTYRGKKKEVDPFEVANTEPEKLDEVRKENWEDRFAGRPSQVVTPEEAERIIDISYPVASINCECRFHSRGQIADNPDDYDCMGLGVGMFKWERWPERYKGGAHIMSPEEGKVWLRKWTKRGMVPILMNYGGDKVYVGGLCICDYPDCYLIRRRIDLGVDLVKGHYVAKVDYDACTGCQTCVSRCQFGAIKYEITTDKANIDMFQCFGCGICDIGCPREAITMVDRETLPGLKEVW